MRYLTCLLLLAFGAGMSALNATPLSLAYELEGPGFAIVQGGVGLQSWKKEPRKIVVDVPASVELALLYWSGRDHPCSPDAETGVCGIPAEEPYRDQVILLDGAPLTGTVIGTELQPETHHGQVLNIGYMADVTETVRSRGVGRLSFAIADGDPASNLTDIDGAGLLVVTSDPAGPAARVIVFHGLDFTYGEDRTPGPTRIAEAITFNHGAARTGRTGALVMFVGDDGSKGPDRIDVSPTNAKLLNRIDGSSGASWDSDRYPVQVPLGNLATTVRLASEPWGKNPDSMLWVMAAMWLPLPVPTGCSPAYWNRDQEQWKYPGLPPSQKLKFIFPATKVYGDVAETTLRAAFLFPDEGGLLGAVRTLVREGGAAVLNSAHFKIEYPLTRTQVLNQVGVALTSGDETVMRAFAAELSAWNHAGCPLK
ncbi:MAG: hypothetical protein QOH06_6229 [Acidobacteriota bacterium]|jgi:hypothetical protein|nr:hypothetical protein [Acidobacteriota bacterium]